MKRGLSARVFAKKSIGVNWGKNWGKMKNALVRML